jgi:putative transposase
VVLAINGVGQFLWRAVDRDGACLELLAQTRRDVRAETKFLSKLLECLSYARRVILTDELGSYQAIHWETLSPAKQGRSKFPNNRAENSHPSTGVRERAIKRFHPAGGFQRLSAARGAIAPYQLRGRDLMSGSERREETGDRFTAWNTLTGASAAPRTDTGRDPLPGVGACSGPTERTQMALV